MPPSYTLLIFEEDPAIREAVREVLEFERYDVVEASDGREALERLRAGLNPCLLLDLMMPITSGWEFRVEQLHDSSLAAIPVVVLSTARHMREMVGPLDAVVRPPAVQVHLDRAVGGAVLDGVAGQVQDELGQPIPVPDAGGVTLHAEPRRAPALPVQFGEHAAADLAELAGAGRQRQPTAQAAAR